MTLCPLRSLSETIAMQVAVHFLISCSAGVSHYPGTYLSDPRSQIEFAVCDQCVFAQVTDRSGAYGKSCASRKCLDDALLVNLPYLD